MKSAIKIHMSLGLLVGVAGSLCVRAQAQNSIDNVPIHADLQMDFRTRVPFHGDVASRLHSNQISLRTAEVGANRFQVVAWGLNQYGSFHWQQASVTLEVSPSSEHKVSQRIEVGLLRLPFGIYDYRETYATGLIDYPLPRLDYAFNAVDWGVRGAKWSGGFSNIQSEVAAFKGSGIGVWGNSNLVDGAAIRLQTYAPPHLILGMSGWQGHQSKYPAPRSADAVRLLGMDWRYTQNHLLIRGEALAGILAGDASRGAYMDVYYRLPDRQRLTMVGRLEFLKPASRQPTARQITFGTRWDIHSDWTMAVNWRRNNMDRAYRFTWTTVSGTRGEWLFQLLRRFTIL